MNEIRPKFLWEEMTLDEIEEALAEYNNNGHAFAPPEVDPTWMRAAGYYGQGAYTDTWKGIDENGNPFWNNFSPIVRNEEAELDRVLTPQELDEYAENVMNGGEDIYGLQVGDTYTDFGEAFNRAQRADELANAYWHSMNNWRKQQEEANKPEDWLDQGNATGGYYASPTPQIIDNTPKPAPPSGQEYRDMINFLEQRNKFSM